ncbi:MAG: 50S ribosomal protein L32 [Desulfobacterales bacterium]|nr:50S ribosomal protein L32 [Desulfobacterales bacterium]MBF0396764.1 50S ribosomal protein L32 [Desulfobacterales bacterium]
MAVPKHRTSKSRRDRRRATQKISAVGVVKCPQCQEAKLPHRICPNCGVYRGRTVIETEEV